MGLGATHRRCTAQLCVLGHVKLHALELKMALRAGSSSVKPKFRNRAELARVYVYACGRGRRRRESIIIFIVSSDIIRYVSISNVDVADTDAGNHFAPVRGLLAGVQAQHSSRPAATDCI